MSAPLRTPPVVVLGSDAPSGVYVLRVALAQPTRLAFGRFKRGRIIALPAGEYVYVGSAMGVKGAASLARRLVRHATRSGAQPPHAIRAALIESLRAAGLGSGALLPRGEKARRWHVDYLLDAPAAELTHIIALRTRARLEAALARHLEHDPQTTLIERGLGAGDAPGSAHLLRVVAPSAEAWWSAVLGLCRQLCAE